MSDEKTNKFPLIDSPEIPDSVDNAVKNLTDTLTKNAGQTFGDIWYLVFGGISHAADKKKMKYAHDLETYSQELNVAIEQIPTGEKVEPSIQVAAQALENSKYCISEPELRKMFVNLISNSMNSRTFREVHPSFPEIIKQMSPLDAEILSEFKKYSAQPIAKFLLVYPGGTSKVLEDYLYFCPEGSHSYYYASSISSLERLGLLFVDFNSCLSDDSQYNNFYDWAYLKHLKKEYENTATNQTVRVRKGVCKLTPLGRHFVDVCLP